MTPTTFAAEVVAGLVVAANANRPFDDSEWEHWVDLITTLGKDGRRASSLVYSAGSGPNRGQRSRLNALAETMPIRVAIVTDSKVSRAAIKGVSWLAKAEVRGFAPDDLGSAFDYLGASDEDRAQMEQVLASLKQTLGLE